MKESWADDESLWSWLLNASVLVCWHGSHLGKTAHASKVLRLASPFLSHDFFPFLNLQLKHMTSHLSTTHIKPAH
jgi:hypothetical protein